MSFGARANVFRPSRSRARADGACEEETRTEFIGRVPK